MATKAPSLQSVVAGNIDTINALRDFALLKHLELPDMVDSRLDKALAQPDALEEVEVWLDAFRDSLLLIDDFVRASQRQAPTTYAYREVAEATNRMLEALIAALATG